MTAASNGYVFPGYESGSYVGRLFGAGSLLAYNSWDMCVWLGDDAEAEAADGCPVSGEASNPTLWRLGATGERVRLRGGVGSFRLLAVGGGRLAVAPTTTPPGMAEKRRGVITVLSQAGRLLATVPAATNDPPRAVTLSSSGLVIERRTRLDVHNPANGALIRTIPLGTSARLQLTGANTRLAVLTAQGHLTLVRLRDGRHVNLPRPAEATGSAWPISARLTDAGLFYAYNVSSTPAKGRIVYIPTQQLLVPFGSSG